MNLKKVSIVTATLLMSMISGSFADQITLINASTNGYYNSAIGTVLDGTSPLFPAPWANDPTINPASEPDLSAASAILGDWLNNPQSLNTNWNYQSIPADWPINTETAIVYEFSGGINALEDVTATFGVDNGIFLWLDGQYKFGALAPGWLSSDEYTVNLGDLGTGTHYLQVLREDHGGSDGYVMSVTGQTKPASVPEPGVLTLLGISLFALVLKRRNNQ